MECSAEKAKQKGTHFKASFVIVIESGVLDRGTRRLISLAKLLQIDSALKAVIDVLGGDERECNEKEGERTQELSKISFFAHNA